MGHWVPFSLLFRSELRRETQDWSHRTLTWPNQVIAIWQLNGQSKDPFFKGVEKMKMYRDIYILSILVGQHVCFRKKSPTFRYLQLMCKTNVGEWTIYGFSGIWLILVIRYWMMTSFKVHPMMDTLFRNKKTYEIGWGWDPKCSEWAMYTKAEILQKPGMYKTLYMMGWTIY